MIGIERAGRLATMTLAVVGSTDALRYPQQNEQQPSKGIIGQEIGRAVNGSEFMQTHRYQFPEFEAEKYNLTKDPTGTADFFALNDRDNEAHGVPVENARKLLFSTDLTDAKGKLRPNESLSSVEYFVKDDDAGNHIVNRTRFTGHYWPEKWFTERNTTIKERGEIVGRHLDDITGGQVTKGKINSTEVLIAILDCSPNNPNSTGNTDKYHYYKELHDVNPKLKVFVPRQSKTDEPTEPTTLPQALASLPYDCGVEVEELSTEPPPASPSPEPNPIPDTPKDSLAPNGHNSKWPAIVAAGTSAYLFTRFAHR